MKSKEKNYNDVLYILEHLRIEDLHELKALFGHKWKQKTLDNIMNTNFQVLTGVDKNTEIPVVMGGIWKIPSANNDIACVWLLATDKVSYYKKSLFFYIKKELNDSKQKYRFLYNFIYSENFYAKKWLKKLGFCFDNPHPDGLTVPDGFEFFYKLN